MSIKMVYGSEPYKRDYELKKILGSESETLYSSSLDADSLAWLSAFSLMGNEKYLVINCDITANDEMLSSLKALPDSNNVVIVAAKAKENTKLFKWLKEHSEIIKADRLKETELIAFIQKGLKANGIDKVENMDQLVEATRYLLNEDTNLYTVCIFIKMLAYGSDDGLVSTTLVDSLKSSDSHTQVWDMLKDLGAKDYEAFIQDGISVEGDPMQTLPLLMWAFRVALKEKWGLDAGVGAYPMRSIRPLVELDESKLSACIELLGEGINAIKTGMTPKAAFTASLSGIAAELS